MAGAFTVVDERRVRRWMNYFQVDRFTRCPGGPTRDQPTLLFSVPRILGRGGEA